MLVPQLSPPLEQAAGRGSGGWQQLLRQLVAVTYPVPPMCDPLWQQRICLCLPMPNVARPGESGDDDEDDVDDHGGGRRRRKALV